MANLPFLISCNLSLFTSSSVLPTSLSVAHPKSPGTRSGSSNMSAMVIFPLFVLHSSAPAKTMICIMPLMPMADGTAFESSHCKSANMGKVTNCEVTNPTVASMETRPCLISASWSHLMSHMSDHPRGSNPTDPMRPSVFLGLVRKGRDLDISALSAVVDAMLGAAGAKAVAVPTRAARVAIFIMVACKERVGGESGVFS
mmetsp:Transcript_857/g.1326  ORF Transcript_857/g.1326 Transcript_857/m.1326 type:complete len:200 (-) Transcript_857:17-616(-)